MKIFIHIRQNFLNFSVLILLLFLLIIKCEYPSNPENICPEADANSESLGIYSETGPMLYQDINCYIGTYSGDESAITIGPDFEEKKEGLKSLRTTLSVGCYENTWGDFECGYAGWFISWGNKDTFKDESCTRKMNEYANGGLSFWIKSTNNLEVGIRSGNVPAGEEESTAYLSHGQYNFESDGNWHKVCIPISHLQGPYPLADLGRIKLLFFISDSYTGGQSITFWIDDVRWEVSPCPNKAPKIESIRLSKSTVFPGETVELIVVASDYEHDGLHYKYEPSGGYIEGAGSYVSWIAPSDPGEYKIVITVSDNRNNSVQDTAKVFVRDIRNNSQPIISGFSTNINKPLLGETITLQVSATDQDGDLLSYLYRVDNKTIEGTTQTTYWTIGPEVKDYIMTVTVEDPYGGRAESSLIISACDADEIGIFSESTYCIISDADSYTGIIVKGRAICDSFSIDSVVKREGESSRKITMSVASRNESCGWFVQHGVEGTDNAFTRDLAKFIDGYLKFSVKSPVDLLVGIRSVEEDSKLLLSEYSNFFPDDNWHDLSIPLKDFAGSPPNLDFTKIKVLFEVLSEQRSGGTGGTFESIWIDNVRWTKGVD